MKNKINYILNGGIIKFGVDQNDQYERERPSIIFRPNGLKYVIIGLIILLITPFIVLPSEIGFIQYDYPDYFKEYSVIEQYIQILGLNIIIILKSIASIEPAFLPATPSPINPNWKWIVAVFLLIADFCSVIMIVTGSKRITFNIGEFKRRKEDVSTLSDL